MIEKSEFFSSFIEIEKRPEFSPDQEVSPDNFKELVGEYRLDEDVICQVRTKKGICHKKHKIGWLGVTLNGQEALIGGHCARTYFKADKTFGLERNRVRKEVERKKALYKLKSYKDNADSFSKRLSAVRQEIIDNRVKLDRIYKGFPNVVLKFIYDAQRMRSWTVKVDILGNDRHSKWTVSPLCNLNPIPKMHDVINLMNRVKEIAGFFDEACQLNIDEISTPRLKRILEILSAMDDCEKLSLLYLMDITRFLEPKNLDAFIYVCDDPVEEFLTGRAILSVSGAKVSSDGHINLRIRRIKERTEKQFGGYQVRKNQLVERYQKNNVFTG
ncbi:TPA: hypothetical protein ACGTP8_004225 [Yersinia enterocolitica]|nr:hypothetical protein [Yersinia enterocolitica]